MICSLRLLNRLLGEALHMRNIVFYSIPIVERATRSSPEYSTGNPRVTTPPLHALLTLYHFFFCSMISRCTYILMVTKLIHKWEIWKYCNLRCRMWFVTTKNRQISTLNHRITNVHPLYTNTTLREISSRYNSVCFLAGSLEHICIVTRGLPVWSVRTSLVKWFKQKRS